MRITVKQIESKMNERYDLGGRAVKWSICHDLRDLTGDIERDFDVDNGVAKLLVLKFVKKMLAI